MPALLALVGLGLASACGGAGAGPRAVAPPQIVGAFASDSGVGLVDSALHVRMVGVADSSQLAWSERGDRLAWVEYVSDDTFTIAQLVVGSTHVVRSLPLTYPGPLAWAGDRLFVNGPSDLGQVSDRGVVTWMHRHDWYDASRKAGASLAGSSGDELLATYTPDGVSGYGGPQSLEMFPADGGAARTLVAFHADENSVTNLPIGHVVAMRDGAVYLATGTRAGGCSMYEGVDRYLGRHLVSTSELAPDVPNLENHYVVVTGIRTDADRTHLFVDVVAMGAECPTTGHTPLRTYELVGAGWRRVAAGSSASTLGSTRFSATLGPTTLSVDGGMPTFGDPGVLRVQRAGAPTLVVPKVSEFVWAGAQSV